MTSYLLVHFNDRYESQMKKNMKTTNTHSKKTLKQNASNQEKAAIDNAHKIKVLLKALPQSCTDFIRSIAMTTSPLTRLAYTIDLGVFFSFICREMPIFAKKSPTEIADSDLAQIKAQDLLAYTDYLSLYYRQDVHSRVMEKTLRNHESGVMRKLSTLRSFFGYLHRSGRIQGNVAALVSLPKLHEKPILYLQQNEIERLLEETLSGENLTPTQKRYHRMTAVRDYAMLMLFLGTGIRISECVSLNLEDIDFSNLSLLVTRKGGNQVILYFPQEVASALQAYLLQRPAFKPLPDEASAMFLSLQHKRITRRAVQIMVKKYCLLSVPLKKKMSPHKLRSTFATQLYHETEDIYLVAEALGHSDVNTTRKHYAAISDQRRREAAQNVHLPAPNDLIPVQNPDSHKIPEFTEEAP